MSSYPSIYNLGHKAVARLLESPVVVQEKVDGSQISFYVKDGELVINSKGARVYLDAPVDMFKKAVEVLTPMKDLIPENYIFRGEYLQKPKHNHLAYARVPKNHIVIFDVMDGYDSESYLAPGEAQVLAEALDFEFIPVFFHGFLESYEQLQQFMKRESFLRGTQVEGVVIKNYSMFGPDKKPLFGKLVSEAFKETQKAAWKVDNPGANDFVDRVTAGLRTEARWQKAVIHLKEQGLLEDSPRDIGKLIAEVQADVLKEEQEKIKELLFNHFWKKSISRGLTAGLPEWYKNTLAKAQFNQEVT